MKKYYAIILLVLFTQLIFGLQDKLIDELGLNQDQVTKIDKIIQDTKSKIEELRTQIQIKQLDLKKLLLQNETKKEAVKDALYDIAKLEAELKYLKYSEEIDIFSLLTEEQKEKYKNIRIKNLKNRDDKNERKDKKDKKDKNIK